MYRIILVHVFQFLYFSSFLFAVLLPHIGSSTYETEEDMAVMTANNILAVLDNTPMPNEVIF